MCDRLSAVTWVEARDLKGLALPVVIAWGTTKTAASLPNPSPPEDSLSMLTKVISGIRIKRSTADLEGQLWDPASPEKAAALEAVRKLLPNIEVIAWPKVQLMDDQGNSNEVDLIPLCPQGVFIVELKGWRVRSLVTSSSGRSATREAGATSAEPLLRRYQG